ncbi:peptidase inhibitor family I36 protein [Actinorugispora endophytica]|uniref:Peptidase inhibitor family I36 n=1 Tax=Actinorugispora endophytica TaxID=1605990 RepID=A0A4V3D8X3_9ACTN|nr:peptidase inhibitor family I36 protein [Actinorugispora endophytica]TDQ53479.1 peptidase inhibitor family I36 [Actinorugispora endophytica]
MSKVRTALASAVLAIAGVAVVGAPASAAAPAEEAGVFRPADPAEWRGSCPKGDVCVWSGHNGTGTRCAWTGDDPDWRSGSVQCRPHGFRVNSIWNNGHPGAYDMVQFFSGAGYQGPLYDPVMITNRPINADSVAIRSHRWV